MQHVAANTYDFFCETQKVTFWRMLGLFFVHTVTKSGNWSFQTLLRKQKHCKSIIKVDFMAYIVRFQCMTLLSNIDKKKKNNNSWLQSDYGFTWNFKNTNYWFSLTEIEWVELEIGIIPICELSFLNQMNWLIEKKLLDMYTFMVFYGGFWSLKAPVAIHCSCMGEKMAGAFFKISPSVFYRRNKCKFRLWHEYMMKEFSFLDKLFF